MFGQGTQGTGKPAGGGLFGGNGGGAPAPAGGLFGSGGGAQASGSAGGLFGGAQAAKPASGGGLFGGAPAGGTTAPATGGGGMFGSSAPKTAPSGGGGLFGGGGAPVAPAPGAGGMFGGAAKPAPAPASSGGMFGGGNASGAPASSGGLFGASTAAKPAPTSGGGLFGGGGAPASNPVAPATSGLFGGGGAPASNTAAPAGGGLFGGGKPAPAPSTGGMFGGAQPTNPAPATGGMFGGAQPTNPSPPKVSGGLFGAASTESKPAASLSLPKPAANGMFGSATTTVPERSGNSGLFGKSTEAKPAAGGGFGAIGAPASTAAASPSLFGGAKKDPAIANAAALGDDTKPAMNLFGAGSQPIRGSSPSPFGQKTEESKGLPPKTGSGLFGGGAPPAAAGGGIQQPKANLFGQDKPQENNFGQVKAAAEAPKIQGSAVPLKTTAEIQSGGNDDAYKQWCETFGKKPLNEITHKWNDQLKKNKQDFDKSSATLQEYEIRLIQQIKAIEGIEKQSDSIMSVYKDNFQDIVAVRNQQEVVIDELTAIENELDSILPKYEQNPMYQDQNYNDLPIREQIQVQAAQVENSVDDLESSLRASQAKINSYMMQSSCQNDEITNNKAMYTNDGQVTNDIQNILTTYYNSLKWIQGTALDLQYQTRDLEGKIENMNQLR